MGGFTRPFILVHPQRRHHALFLASLGSHFVGYLEPKFDCVALTGVDAVQNQVLLHTVLLLRRDVSAGLRPER